MKNTVIVFTKEEINLVAKSQQWLLISFLVNLFIKGIIEIVGTEAVISIPLFIILIFCFIIFLTTVFKLAKALKKQAGLYVIGIFLPLANLVLIYHLITQATKLLKENNIKVGVMGAK